MFRGTWSGVMIIDHVIITVENLVLTIGFDQSPNLRAR